MSQSINESINESISQSIFTLELQQFLGVGIYREIEDRFYTEMSVDCNYWISFLSKDMKKSLK